MSKANERKPVPPVQQCSVCRFWRASDEPQTTGLGRCHVEPPVPVFCQLMGLMYVRPLTQPDSFCGRFERRPS